MEIGCHEGSNFQLVVGLFLSDDDFFPFGQTTISVLLLLLYFTFFECLFLSLIFLFRCWKRKSKFSDQEMSDSVCLGSIELNCDGFIGFITPELRNHPWVPRL